MLKRLKRLWALSKKDPAAIKKLESLTKEDLAYIPEAGDGNAVFFSEGTEADYDDFKKEQTGLKAWYERIRNL